MDCIWFDNNSRELYFLTFFRLDSLTSTNETFSSFLSESNFWMSVVVLMTFIVSEFLKNEKNKNIETFIIVNIDIVSIDCKLVHTFENWNYVCFGFTNTNTDLPFITAKMSKPCPLPCLDYHNSQQKLQEITVTSLFSIREAFKKKTTTQHMEIL